MKERVSKLTYPTLQHCLRMLYTMNGNSKHKGWAIGQKREYKLLLKRIKSAFPVKMHIYTLCPSKFHAILLRGFGGVVLTNCFSSIFHFRQISKFKKGVNPRKKNGIKISCEYAQVHIMSFITTKFHENQRCCANKKNSSIFHFGQISKLKKGVTPRKKVESKFPMKMHIYTLCPSLLQSFRKFC